MPNVYAYYLWPPVWVGTNAREGFPDVDIRVLSEEVHRDELQVGISVRCLRGGMFIFDFSKWPQGMDPAPEESWDRNAVLSLSNRRISVFNTHVLSLNTALSRRQKMHHPITLVTPREVIRMDSFEGFQMGFRDPRVAELALAQFPSAHNPNLPTGLDWRILNRTDTLEIETLQTSFGLLSAVLKHSNPDALLLSDLHARSCNAYEESNFNLCLTISWTVTEKLLNILWKRYIDDNRMRKIDGSEETFINGERKKFLCEDHRSFTASVIAEVLSLADALPFSIYQELKKIRKARNDWLHELEPITWDEALSSVKVAEKMLNFVEGLDFDASLAFSY